MISICFVYFRSLTLDNLRASLFSVRQQDLSRVNEIVVLDNNTDDSEHEIQAVIDGLRFTVPVKLLSRKHGDSSKTHSWSTNEAVRAASSPWIFFTRADYVLHFDMLHRTARVIGQHTPGWHGFVTSNGYHLNADIAACERTRWREDGPAALREFPGMEFTYTVIDAGVWALPRAVFAEHELDESLTYWGHSQTEFQHRLYVAGIEFVRIPEVLFYHPQHIGERDLDLANRQLKLSGKDIKDMWERYDGEKPYK